MSTENMIPPKTDSLNRISPQNNVSPDKEIIDNTTLRNKIPSNNEKYNNSKDRVSNQNINEININKENRFNQSRN